MPADPVADAGSSSRSSSRRRKLRTAQEVRDQRRRAIRAVLLVISAALMVNALIGEKGYLASVRAQREYDEALASLTHLREVNQALRDEARRLAEDDSALEEAARRELGLLRPGETLVIVKDADRP